MEPIDVAWQLLKSVADAYTDPRAPASPRGQLSPHIPESTFEDENPIPVTPEGEGKSKYPPEAREQAERADEIGYDDFYAPEEEAEELLFPLTTEEAIERYRKRPLETANPYNSPEMDDAWGKLRGRGPSPSL